MHILWLDDFIWKPLYKFSMKNNVCVCVGVCIHECIQAYLGDILSSASDHHNENKFEVMPSHTNFVFPAHIKVMFLLYCCVLSVK